LHLLPFGGLKRRSMGLFRPRLLVPRARRMHGQRAANPRVVNAPQTAGIAPPELVADCAGGDRDVDCFGLCFHGLPFSSCEPDGSRFTGVNRRRADGAQLSPEYAWTLGDCFELEAKRLDRASACRAGVHGDLPRAPCVCDAHVAEPKIANNPRIRLDSWKSW